MKNYMHLETRQDFIDSALNEFYSEMNHAADMMKLRDTNFITSHGMHHDRNFSSAHDIAVISHRCMKNSTFR
jgi:serine-type D-Ala-D-Ala carboxypeptidase (penicillin-binding protein 5/6)